MLLTISCKFDLQKKSRIHTLMMRFFKNYFPLNSQKKFFFVKFFHKKSREKSQKTNFNFLQSKSTSFSISSEASTVGSFDFHTFFSISNSPIFFSSSIFFHKKQFVFEWKSKLSKREVSRKISKFSTNQGSLNFFHHFFSFFPKEFF